MGVRHAGMQVAAALQSLGPLASWQEARDMHVDHMLSAWLEAVGPHQAAHAPLLPAGGPPPPPPGAAPDEERMAAAAGGQAGRAEAPLHYSGIPSRTPHAPSTDGCWQGIKIVMQCMEVRWAAVRVAVQCLPAWPLPPCERPAPLHGCHAALCLHPTPPHARRVLSWLQRAALHPRMHACTCESTAVKEVVCCVARAAAA